MAASSGPSSLAKLQQNVNVGGIGFFLEVVRVSEKTAVESCVFTPLPANPRRPDAIACPGARKPHGQP